MNAPSPSVRLFPRKDGVLELSFAQGAVITLDIATQASDLVRTARGDGLDGPVLVDLSNIAGADLEAHKVQPANDRGRVALVLTSFLTQALLDMFLRLNRDGVERRVFRRRELALDWLLDG